MKNQSKFTRRHFMKAGSIMAAGSMLSNPTVLKADEDEAAKIKAHRVLGRTGFKISDIGMGCNKMSEANLVRYAYDKGVNYFDTAEGYGNGDSERKIGEALQNMDREKVFITTKLHISEDESAESIMKRFEQCRKRLQTDYVDTLLTHNPNTVVLLNHPGFHQVAKELISSGRLRFRGASCHGPHSGRSGDSMEKVLVTAAEDGRFDVILMVYNFMNQDAGNKILEACKKNNVGTTAMKITPNQIKAATFDPKNPTKEQQKSLKRILEKGGSQEEAEQKLASLINDRNEDAKKYQAFQDKYGIKTNEQLDKSSLQWALGDQRMNTVLISMREFEIIDNMIPLSGTKLTGADDKWLEKYGQLINDKYCRHGCNLCEDACPHAMPVSTIMRYSHYALNQGREKYGMSKYAALGDNNAEKCLTCDGQCANACPFEFNIQANLVKSHNSLTLA